MSAISGGVYWPSIISKMPCFCTKFNFHFSVIYKSVNTHVIANNKKIPTEVFSWH